VDGVHRPGARGPSEKRPWAKFAPLDRRFTVVTNDPARALRFFANGGGYRTEAGHGPALRRQLLEDVRIGFEVATPGQWSDRSSFVEGVKQVCHERRGRLPADTDEAASIVALCRLAVEQLQAIGSAVAGNPYRER